MKKPTNQNKWKKQTNKNHKSNQTKKMENNLAASMLQNSSSLIYFTSRLSAADPTHLSFISESEAAK